MPGQLAVPPGLGWAKVRACPLPLPASAVAAMALIRDLAAVAIDAMQRTAMHDGCNAMYCNAL